MQVTTINRLAPALLLLATACTAAPPTAGVERFTAPAPELQPTPAPVVELEDSATTAVLERGLGHAAGMTEVVLDPRGEAALTLDSDGGVRLWPNLGGDPASSDPYRIPVHEPLWLSLGKRSDRGFLLGFIGTNNAGTVYRVDVPSEGPARIVESFALSPEDPLLELHVLDGGERVIALGIDHRVRLYAADGTLLSQLDERGFGPWQLRVNGGVDEPPTLAAVLAQPLRIQPLRLVDDRLEIAGPARNVELDRGPNRNDLALSPDGTTVAALRRPHKHDRQWSVELIDLATDERKLIAGRMDTKVRPRMHFDRNDALLLESGSGQAWRVDLAAAVTPRDADDLHPDSKLAKRLAKQLGHEVVALPASGERSLAVPDDDSGIRMHASVVNGVRASIDVAADRRLVVGGVDQPTQLRLGHARLDLRDAAFDASGSTLVWAANGRIHVERLGEPDAIRSHRNELGAPLGVAVPGRDRAVILTQYSATEFDLVSGEQITDLTLPTIPTWNARTQFAPAAGGGELGYLSDDRNAPVWVVELGGALSARAVEPAAADRWVHLRSVDYRTTQRLCVELELPCEGGELFARDASGRPMFADSEALHLFEPGAWSTVEVPGKWTHALEPSPVGTRLALSRRASSSFADQIVSVVDTATGELAWSWSSVSGSVDKLRWSPDGRRLAVVTRSAGFVFDVATGELVHERSSLPLEIETISRTD